jgi:nitrous oxidase accessory protein NosD
MTIHKVDCDAGERIQDRIAGAKPGDTIVVSGTCRETINIPSEVIRITLDGQGKAVIDVPAKGDGFFIRGKDVTIKGFTISAGRDGIHLSGAAGGAAATIEGNVIRKTGRHGIHMDHSGVSRIAGNTIEEVPGFGIDVGESSVARIGYLLRPLGRAANTIRRCGEHGIAVTRASAARIVGNKIEDVRSRPERDRCGFEKCRLRAERIGGRLCGRTDGKPRWDTRGEGHRQDLRRPPDLALAHARSAPVPGLLGVSAVQPCF